MREDFQRLLATPFLDNLSIHTRDYTFPNGTIGNIVQYDMEERERIKLGPDFEGSKKLELSKIDEALKLAAPKSGSIRSSTRRRCARSKASSAT